MIIGFFADDASASHAALLAKSAFSRNDPCGSGILAGGPRIADAVPTYIESARARHSHLMVALPLDHIDDRSLRVSIDLAVITFGPGKLAHEGARQAMAAKAAQTAHDLAPPWLLAGPTPLGTPRPPHTLPIRVPPLRTEEAASLRAGCTCGNLHRRAVGLAAALRIAADDPYAGSLDPAYIAELMAGETPSTAPTASEMRLRKDLLDLADGLDDPTSETIAVKSARRRIPGTARRRPAPLAPHQGPTAVRRTAGSGPGSLRHDAGCACAP